MPSFLILLALSLAVASAPSMPTRSAKTGEIAAPVTVAPVEIVKVSAATAPEIPPVIAKIKEAVGDLQMPSETDAPMRVEFWPSEKSAISPAEVALFAATKPQDSVETQSVAEFFAGAILIEDWMSDDEKATAKRFQTLVEVLNADLENPRVYLFGERERTVVIIGKVKGGFGGVVTLVVET